MSGEDILQLRYTRGYSLLIVFMIVAVIALDTQYRKNCADSACKDSHKRAMMTILALDTFILVDTLTDLIVYVLASDAFRHMRLAYYLTLLFDVVLIAIVANHMLEVRDDLRGV